MLMASYCHLASTTQEAQRDRSYISKSCLRKFRNTCSLNSCSKYTFNVFKGIDIRSNNSLVHAVTTTKPTSSANDNALSSLNQTLESLTSSTSAPVIVKKEKTISWAGAGVFFFWQLGSMKYLAERYDLTKVPMVGASGGALAAVLAACGVSADTALQRAYDISSRNNIWDRPIAKLGTFGALIEQWLNEILPDDAAERCRNRITVVVTTFPNMSQVGLTDFVDKADLINCVMSSSHIPVCLDFRVTRSCRGMLCVDGSLPDFFYNDNCELLKRGGSAVIFDYCMDKQLVRKGRMDMLTVKSYNEVVEIMGVGYRYAESLHLRGHLDHLELGEVALNGLDERPDVLSTIDDS